MNNAEVECYSFSSCAHTNILSQLDFDFNSNLNTPTNCYYTELSLNCPGSYSCYNVSLKLGSNTQILGGFACKGLYSCAFAPNTRTTGTACILLNVFVLTLFGIVNRGLIVAVQGVVKGMTLHLQVDYANPSPLG